MYAQRELNEQEQMQRLILEAHAGDKHAQATVTYVSNHKLSETYNQTFRAHTPQAQKAQIEALIQTQIVPMLARDGGGVRLVHYVPETTPQIWLKYEGHCAGCHLGATTTADMMLKIFEAEIDRNIILYVW